MKKASPNNHCAPHAISRQGFLRAALVLAASPLLRYVPAEAAEGLEVSEVAPASSPDLASYWVLEGDAVFTVDGEELDAPAGSWVQIPPGVAHGAAGVRLLSVRAPA